MAAKQLNVWIEGTLKDALTDRAKRENTSMTNLTEHILRQAMARQSSETIEQQALPLLQEIVATEVPKETLQLLGQLRKEIHQQLMDEIKTVMRLSDDRLAKLIMRAVRDAGIGRRLAMAQLSKAYGPDFARSAYESAREDVGKELAPKEPSQASPQEASKPQERQE